MIKRAAWIVLAFGCIALVNAVDAAARSLVRDGLPFDLPFDATLSNTAPLVFGMSADDAARALGTPLYRLQGKPGAETFLAIRSAGGGGLFPRDDRLYLQFRHGRLTGFKGDWGRNWMWR